jgi:hypothetical protein
MKREHKWNKDDTIITLYYYKFGIRRLPVKTDSELAETIIGSSLDSLRMQSANVSYIISKKGLDCPSKLQKDIVEEYDKMGETDLRNEVLQIIGNTDRVVIVAERIQILKEKEKENKKKDEKKKLDIMFRKMGKDPSKMRSIGIRPKTEEDKEVVKV